MITTKLPYKIELLDEISQNGAIVDISNPQFDGIELKDKNRVILIYFRNTGFTNIKLDFSNCLSEDKFELLYLYITDSIECNIEIFKTTWLKILSKYNNIQFNNLNSFLTDNEIDIFINKNKNLLFNLSEFYYSLPLFLLTRIKSLTLTNYEQILDTVPININGLKLLDDNFLINIGLIQNRYKRTFYSNVFTIENTTLFEALVKTIFGFILELQLNK